MRNLFDDFEALPLPSKDNLFSAVPVKGHELHRLGKDIKSAPSILLTTIGRDSAVITANQKLYNLSILHDLECEIETSNGINTGFFTVITYSGGEDGLKEYFLRVCETLIDSLSSKPSNEEIRKVANSFVELFRAVSEPPKKTVQGLWAELFLIAESKSPTRFVSAWHSKPEEKYDFSFESIRLEVKSSSSRKRAHHFSQEQLMPISGSRILVASIFVEPSSAGKSIADLLMIIESELKSRKAINKLRLLTYKTLGHSISELQHSNFDYQLATDSFLIFDAENIPSISHSPNGVSEIKFRSSLEHIAPSNIALEEIK